MAIDPRTEVDNDRGAIKRGLAIAGDAAVNFSPGKKIINAAGAAGNLMNRGINAAVGEPVLPTNFKPISDTFASDRLNDTGSGFAYDKRGVTGVGDMGQGVPVGHNPPPSNRPAMTAGGANSDAAMAKLPVTVGGKEYTTADTNTAGIKRVDGGSSPLFTNLDTATAVGGLDKMKSGQAFVGTDGAPSGPLDSYGNGTTQTAEMQAQLVRMQGTGGIDQGPKVSYMPSSSNADTQGLFDKWAREAMSKEMMNKKGGHTSVASMYNNAADQQWRLAGIGMQGANRLAEVGMQGQNQLAGLDLQGRTQRDVAQLQGQNQMAGIDAQGRNQMDVAMVNAKGQREDRQLANEGHIAGITKAAELSAKNNVLPPELAGMLSLAEKTQDQGHVAEVMQLLRNYRAGQQGGQAAPSPDMVAALRKNPHMAEDFDKKFGAGSAQRAMGGS